MDGGARSGSAARAALRDERCGLSANAKRFMRCPLDQLGLRDREITIATISSTWIGALRL